MWTAEMKSNEVNDPYVLLLHKAKVLDVYKIWCFSLD